MAQIDKDLHGQNENAAAHKPLIIHATPGEAVTLPDGNPAAQMDILRDGQNLVLRAPDGSVVVVEGYFLAQPPPPITDGSGTVLTPQLVESFVHHDGPAQYASNTTASDASPVGVIKEVSGHDTITRTDGTKEQASAGMPVFKGDVIETDAHGAVNIVFRDDSSFAVSQNAKLAIDDFVYDPSASEPGSGASNFSMLRGMFVYTSGLVGRADPDDVHIQTPAGSIGIRGTVIAGNVDNGEITVVEGAIVLHTNSGELATLSTQFATARFNTSGHIDSVNTPSAGDVAAKFSSLGSVAPSFFTSIGGGENAGHEENGAAGHDSGATPQTPATTAHPADGAHSDNTTTAPAQDSNTGTTTADTSDSFSSADTFSSAAGTTSSSGTNSGSGSAGTTATTSSSTTTTTGSSTTASTAPPPATTTTTPPPPPNTAPTITAPGGPFNINENSTNGTVVGHITAADPDAGQTLTYSITGGNTGNAFAINGNGDIVVNSPVDFETLNSYNLTVTATDNGLGFLSASTTATINVNNVNDAPVVQANTLGIAENSTGGTVVGTVAATDQDTGQTLSYAITAGNAGGAFAINATTGQITVNGAIDYETLSTYTLTVSATDNGAPVLAGSNTITINVGNLDDVASVLPTNTGATDSEGGSIVLTTAMLHATDIDTADAGITYTVTTSAANGQLELTTAPGTPITSFTEADLAAGHVQYVHDGSNTTTDGFTFSVGDGTNASITGQTFSLTITPVNNAPTIDTNTGDMLALNNGISFVIDNTMLHATDSDTAASGLVYTVTTGPADGTLVLASAVGTPITSFTQADLDANQVVYLPNAGDPGTDSFAFTLNDGTNNVPGTFNISYGAGTNDAYTLSAGNDVAYGGAGNDTFAISGINTQSYGGTGNDTFTVTTDASSNVYGGAGSDTYDASALSSNLDFHIGTGTVSDGSNTGNVTGIETFIGGTGTNRFFALNGDGSQTLDSTSGTGIYDGVGLTNNMTVDFSAMTVAAGGDTDTLLGPGWNYFFGGSGTNTYIVYDNDGNYTFNNATGYDIYDASNEASDLTFDLSNGTITSSSGTDTTDPGFEEFRGGSGNDQFLAWDNDGSQTLDGGSGYDSYDASGATNNLTFDLGAGTVTDGTYTDSVINIEEFRGGSGINTFIAADGDGDQTLYGFGSSDSYDASAVTSALTFTFSDSGSTVTISDGSDLDTLINIENFDGSSTAINTIDLSAITVTTTADLSAGTVSYNGWTYTFLNADQILGGSGEDSFIVSSVDGIAVDGGAGGVSDLYDASSVSANLTVTMDASGSGTVSDGSDTDTMTGGIDMINTGAGNDTFVVTDSNYTYTFDAGAGSNTLDYSGITAGGVIADLTINQVAVAGSAINYIYSFDTVIGTNYNDTLIGGTGTVLHGGSGSDTIAVTADDFSLADGGTGTDTLQLDTASSTFNLDTAVEQVRGIETIDANNAFAQTINLTLDSQAFTTTTAGQITINLDAADTLKLDLTGLNFHWLSDNGSTFSYTDGTNTVSVNYLDINNVSVVGTPLNLNNMNNSDGFWITDSVSRQFGASITSMGDKNHDGFDDLLIGRGLGDATFSLSGGAALTDMAATSLVTSGVNGDSNVTDMSLSYVGDFNGDGVADFIAGLPTSGDFDNVPGNSGNAMIMDANNNPVVQLNGLNSGDFAGASVAGIGDINHDGFSDVIIGAPHAGGSNNGSAFLLFGHPHAANTPLDVNMLGAGVVGTAVAGGGTIALDFNAATNRVMTLHNGTVKLYDYDVNTHLMGAAVNVNNANLNNATAFDTYSNFAWVVNNAGMVTRINVSSETVSGGSLSATQASGAIDMVTVLGGSAAYILTNTGKVDMITSLSGSMIDSGYTNGTGSTGIANAMKLAYDGTFVYVLCDSGAANDGGIKKLDPSSTGTAFQPLVVPGTALDGAVDFVVGGGYGYVITNNAGSSSLVVINLGDGSIVNTINLGINPALNNLTGIDINSTGTAIYVSADDASGNGAVATFDIGASAANPALTSMYAGAQLDGAHGVVAAGTGANEMPIVFSTTSGNINSVDTSLDGIRIDGAGNNLLGMNVASAGDFNHDGISDFLISMPGSGNVALVYGHTNMTSINLVTDAAVFTGIATDANNEIPVFNLGDINGDGISDIAMAAPGANGGNGQIYVMFGGGAYAAGSSYTAATSANVKIFDPGHEIVGGGAVGDFNGDGFKDSAVAMRDTSGAGDHVDIYVIYGSSGLAGTLNTAWLNDPTHAFHMTYTIPTGVDVNNFDITVAAAGDINGDGFYDLALGLPNIDTNPGVDTGAPTDGNTTNDTDGGTVIVYGSAEGAQNVVVQGTNPTATANNESLVGDAGGNSFSDAYNTGISFSGGAGNDMMIVNSAAFKVIDGGAGNDTLTLGNTGLSLDFTNVGSERLSRIEAINMSASTGGQSVILTLNNVFSLMQTSDNGNLQILSGGTVNHLSLNNQTTGAQVGANDTQIAQLLGAKGFTSNVGGFDNFDFGGHTLQIDHNLVAAGKVDVV